MERTPGKSSCLTTLVKTANRRRASSPGLLPCSKFPPPQQAAGSVEPCYKSPWNWNQASREPPYIRITNPPQRSWIHPDTPTPKSSCSYRVPGPQTPIRAGKNNDALRASLFFIAATWTTPLPLPSCSIPT